MSFLDFQEISIELKFYSHADYIFVDGYAGKYWV